MFGVCALVVVVRKTTNTKAVRVILLKDSEPLPSELVRVGIWAGLKEAAVARPVLNTSNILEVFPSNLWVAPLQSGPDLLVTVNLK